jgi:hypothetical protein
MEHEGMYHTSGITIYYCTTITYQTLQEVQQQILTKQQFLLLFHIV